MTDDEQPEMGATPGHDELDPNRIVAAYVLNQPPEWPLSKVKDMCLENVVVLGSQSPVWEIQENPCQCGGHVDIWLVDTANECGYLLWSIPKFQVMIQGGQTNIDPNYLRAEIVKRNAILN